MRTVEQEQVASSELALPPSVQEALGELVSAAKDGLLALSVGVGVGLGVLSEMMEAEHDEVVGEGQPQPWPQRRAPWPRGRRGHAGRAPGRGRAPAAPEDTAGSGEDPGVSPPGSPQM